MFLKSIHIKNYNQFENLKLDLTYPKGHAKAGEPLEKICIIGDNGTGKTTILELIKEYYNSVTKLKSIRALNLNSGVTVDTNRRKIKKEDGEVVFHNTSGISENDYLTSRGFKLLLFPTGPDLSTLPELIKTRKTSKENNNGSKVKAIFDEDVFGHDLAEIFNSGIISLGDKEALVYWKKLKGQIKKSIDKELEYRRSLLKGMNEQNEAAIDEIYKKFKGYKKKNPNGYDDLAAFLNPLLSKFHLELNTKINLDKFDEIEFLSLISKDGKIIPIEQWSTGIRQLIYTMLPLYTLKPETGIIMIDEAERSLYPNTQRILIDFYKSICPNMQLIFATHSPILASSFEPWEVIELKFNENGKVERKPYFKGENHVDNYHIRPMYLQWDSLFMKMFGLENDSNEVRNDMLMELALLKRDLKKSNGADKEELQKKYETLAEQLDWATL